MDAPQMVEDTVKNDSDKIIDSKVVQEKVEVKKEEGVEKAVEEVADKKSQLDDLEMPPKGGKNAQKIKGTEHTRKLGRS